MKNGRLAMGEYLKLFGRRQSESQVIEQFNGLSNLSGYLLLI